MTADLLAVSNARNPMPGSDRGVAVGAGEAERRPDERRVDQRRDTPIS